MAKKPKVGTGVAVRPAPQAKPKQDESAQKLPALEDLLVPAALLLAAEVASAKNEATRAYLCGVYLHSVDGQGRIVGTDGQRLFIGSFPIEGAHPAWLQDGVILSNEGLSARVKMMAKGSAQVRVRYAKGVPLAELSDAKMMMVFRQPLVEGEYPQYQRIIPTDAFATYDEDGNSKASREWEPIGINSRFLKHVGEIAKMLDAGLPSDDRSPKGMVVRAFNSGSDANAPLVFDFSTYPGAILIVGAAKLATPAISARTAALLAPAIKATIAALRAHATRNQAWAEAAGSPGEKDAFLAKAAGFQARVDSILARAPGLPAVEAPEPEAAPASEPEAAPDPESEADNAEQDEADATRMSGDPDEPDNDSEEGDGDRRAAA